MIKPKTTALIYLGDMKKNVASSCVKRMFKAMSVFI